MPLNDLFTYELTKVSGEDIAAKLKINYDHKIFQGHFPGNPVLPGVTQIEFIRKILSEVLECEILLKSARDIKYLNPMTPENAREINFQATISRSEGELSLKGTFSKDDLIFTKIRGIFSES